VTWRSAAVVGATGLIGSALSARLALAGVRVAAFSRARPALGRDGRPVRALLAADVVFYLAASYNPATAGLHPDLVRADHGLFVRLLDALAGTGHAPLVVLASSSGVYDPAAPLPYAEDSPTGPVTPYGTAKLLLERELTGRQATTRGTVLRLASVYGPGQRTGTGQGVVAHWLEAAAAGQPLRLYGDPATVRDYVYVDDVVQAMCDVADRAGQGRRLPLLLNVGSGEATSLARLHGVIESVLGRDLGVDVLPHRSYNWPDSVLDVRLAASVLGWRRRTPLPEGIARTWRALRANTPVS
jgi:UDP-glucose 4-epimerase